MSALSATLRLASILQFTPGMTRDRARGQAGVTMIELLVVVAVIGITFGAASVYLKPAAAPHREGAVLVENHLRMVRARAVATTSAYRVTPADGDSLQGEYASSCSDTTWTDDTELDIDLPQDARFAATSWSVCFTARGASSANVLIDVDGLGEHSGRVEVLLGGGVRLVQ